VVTGKPISIGGSQGRRAATGRGVAFCVAEAAKDLKLDLTRSSTAVQGFGNVGSNAALFLHGMGVKITAVSDVFGAVRNVRGLDIPGLIKHVEATGRVEGFAGSDAMERDALFTEPVDILVPAALENAITGQNAPDIKARLVAEGANGPMTPEAIDILAAKGVTVIPDILCNAGGVTVSYFEWVQNRQEFYWTAQKVDEELKAVMVRAYRGVADEAARNTCSLREAAYRIAITRVADAAYKRGTQ
jgi:glutamate dehydrogenase/leucine dehydrogenase